MQILYVDYWPPLPYRPINNRSGDWYCGEEIYSLDGVVVGRCILPVTLKSHSLVAEHIVRWRLSDCPQEERMEYWRLREQYARNGVGAPL